MNVENIRASARHAAALTFVMLCIGSSSAHAAELRSDRSSCYSYLTELVRSSTFPFRVARENVNLIIDDDEGDVVSAQVAFDTQGTGTLGWIQYVTRTRQLLNTSAELETPMPLTFAMKWADQYDRCIHAN